MSVPLKIMYSNTSSRGATGRSVGRSSVPNERTAKRDAKRDDIMVIFKERETNVKVFKVSKQHLGRLSEGVGLRQRKK